MMKSFREFMESTRKEVEVKQEKLGYYIYVDGKTYDGPLSQSELTSVLRDMDNSAMYVFKRKVKESIDSYKSLADAAKEDTVFSVGRTEIWYMKPDLSRDLSMGYNWCKKQGCLPDPKNLDNTHVLLGKIGSEDEDEIFDAMQGEFWSPNGEARNLIKSKGLAHTSMSVGDVIVIRGKAMMVDGSGFRAL